MNQHTALTFFMSLAFLFTACDDDVPGASTSQIGFSYNAANGTCVDKNGNIGYNAIDLTAVRATKNCECTDLSGQKLVYLLDVDNIENFIELGYNELSGYNFKGAKFDRAELFFNIIHDADFQGADLSKVAYGYATLHGKIDAFTKLPERCTVSDQMINCSQ